MKPASLKRQTSSGGVIYRNTGEGIEVVLVSVKGGKNWCLPKGLVDKGETPELTALREVKEESGLTGRIIDKLGDITYWYYIQDKNIKCRKTVHFFLMEYVEGDTSDHDLEVDDAVWFPIETALSIISYRGDRGILEKASDRLTGMNVS